MGKLTFDFSSEIGNTYNRLVVIPDFVTTTRTTNNTLYFDNIQLPEGGAPAETCSDGIMNQDETGIDCGGSVCAPCAAPVVPPTVPAPTPPARNAADVLSIYSDAYTDITIDDFDFGLCSSSPAVTEVMIAGNPTQQYLGEGCQGISIENNRIDASTFTNLHFDFYTKETPVIGRVLI